MKKHIEYYLFALFFIGLGTQVYLQLNSLISHDVLWSFEVGKRMFAGKSYLHDFFETNPPLLYYFHGVLVSLASALKTSPMVVYSGFLTLSSIISFFVSYHLFSSVFSKDKVATYVLMTTLIFMYCFIFNSEYGQKEMIMTTFCMPYFFAVVHRRLNRDISTRYALFVGLLAGLGIAFKPPYLYIPIVFTELYLLVYKRSLTAFFRPEVVSIALVQVFYFLSICIISPSYIYHIFPLILQAYVPETYASPFTLVTDMAFRLFALTSLAWLFFYKHLKSTSPALFIVTHVFFWVSLSTGISYVLQGKGWLYQALPFVSAYFIFLILVSFAGIRKYHAQRIEQGLILLCTTLVVLSYYILPTAIYAEAKVLTASNEPESFVSQVKQFSQKHAKETFFMFSTSMQAAYFIYYGQLNLGSRFASLWPLPGAYNMAEPDSSAIKNKVRDYVVEDFERFKPSLVLVNYSHYDYIKHKPFDYLSFMKENATFRKIWKNYHWVERIEPSDTGYYTFDVYTSRQ